MRRWLALVGAVTMMLALLPIGVGAAAADEGDVIAGSYIVVLSAGNPGAVAAEHGRAHNASVTHVYRHALRGYAARMSSRAAARVADDPRVAYVDVDRVMATAHHRCGHTGGPGGDPCPPEEPVATYTVSGTVTTTDSDPLEGVAVAIAALGVEAITGSDGTYAIADVPDGSHAVEATRSGYDDGTRSVLVEGADAVGVDFQLSPTTGEEIEPTYGVPTGLERIFWNDSSAVDAPVGVGVAIIDTGIAADHPDLDVVGGHNCSNGPTHRWGDGNGHGTHVAGTAAADGAIVGVARGAPLYAVRVLDNNGSGSWSSVICGVDWVTANAATIKVANMSLGGGGTAGATCSSSALRQAVCDSVEAGVTYVVAAGNSADDAAGYVPAAYPEVITVAAIADFDGLPGGLAEPTCQTDVDDSHADFSNYGAADVVDLTAPGVCITSTWSSGSGYHTISGTSMSSPHVAGAAALWLDANAGDPAAVRTALEAATNADYRYTWSRSDDLGGVKPPLLDVRSL